MSLWAGSVPSLPSALSESLRLLRSTRLAGTMAQAKGLLVAGLLLLASVSFVASAQEDRPRRVVNVSLEDEGCPEGPDRFCVRPANVTLEEDTDLVLQVANEGRIAHNLTFAEGTPAALAAHGMNGTLEANETTRLRIPWTAIEDGLGETGEANTTLECGRDGHAALGERFRIEVPSLAASEENPQPGVGAAGVLLALGAVAWARRRS